MVYWNYFLDIECVCVSGQVACKSLIQSVILSKIFFVKIFGGIIICFNNLSHLLLGSNQGSNNLTLKGWPLTVRVSPHNISVNSIFNFIRQIVYLVLNCWYGLYYTFDANILTQNTVFRWLYYYWRELGILIVARRELLKHLQWSVST